MMDRSGESTSKSAEYIDKLNEKIKALKKEYESLQDPAVVALIKEMGTLNNQISETMNGILGIKQPIESVTKSIDKQKSAIDKLVDGFEAFMEIYDKVLERQKYTITAAATDPASPLYIPLAEFDLSRKTDSPKGSVGAEHSDYIQSIRDSFTDIEVDKVSLSMQFAAALAMAFRSSSVTNSIAGVMTAGVTLAASLSAAGVASGNPYVAGIALVAGVVDMFSKPKAPVMTKPVEVYVVNLDEITETIMLGISRRQLISVGAGAGSGSFQDTLYRTTSRSIKRGG